MSKKGKTLSIVTVLLLVLSLMAVIPAGFAGAATTGTIELNQSTYSLASTFDAITVTVTDADVDVVRSGSAIFLDANVTFTGAAATSFTLASADSISGEDVTDEDVSADAAGDNSVFQLKTAAFWVDGGGQGQLGDADADGNDADDTGDASATVDGVAATIEVLDTSAGTVTLDAAAESDVLVTYNFHEYDISDASNSPMAGPATDVTVSQGTDEFTGVSFSDSRATINVSGGVTEGGGDVTATFTYDVKDTITAVTATSDTRAASTVEALADPVSVTLTETTPSSGVFNNSGGTLQLEDEDDVNAAELQVSDGDTITVTYSDADPAADRTATAIADLAAPSVSLVEPADGLSTQDTLPNFKVEVTDSVSPNATAADYKLFMTAPGGNSFTEIGASSIAKATAVNGFRLTFQQGTALADGTVKWYAESEDAVGNTTAAVTGGGTADPYEVTIDTTAPSSFTATAGFGVNEAGTARTRDDNTGIELDFIGAIDGASVAASDFDVTGSSAPLAAFHATTLKNTETIAATADGNADDDVIDFTEFTALDVDLDSDFEDDITVTVDGTTETVIDASGTSVTIADLDADADVAITYTFDSSDRVYLTVAALATDATPAVALVSDIDDVAGNTVGAAAALDSTSADTFDPIMTVSLDAALVGDPDDDGTGSATLTITSSEALPSAPNVTGAGLTIGTVTAVADATNTWTSVLTNDTSGTSVTDVSITAAGTDAAGNAGTSSAVTLTIDVTNPSAPTFTPTDADPPDTVNQGLSDIVRVTAAFGEATTVTSSTLEGSLDQITVALLEDNNSGQTGTATLTARGTKTLVELSVTSGISGIQHIHAGTGPDDILGVVYDLGTIGEDGTSSTLVEASLDDLREGDFIINLHDKDDASIYTSNGAIPLAADVSANTFTDDDGVTKVLGLELAVGTYTWSITVEDAADNSSGAQELNFEVVAPTSFTIALDPGWNLISVPSRLDAATPAKVFGDTSPTVTKVRTWSSAAGWQVSSFVDGAWAGDILTLKQGLGYWVFSDTADDVSVVLRRLPGIPTAPRPQALVAGWNLIGPQFFNLPAGVSVDADDYLTGVSWSVAYGFDPDPATGFTRIAPVGDDVLAAGSGYWVYLTEAGEIVP